MRFYINLCTFALKWDESVYLFPEHTFYLIFKNKNIMIYTKEVNDMCVVAKGPNHGPAPIPEEGKWCY